jgi:hypothetical protein
MLKLRSTIALLAATICVAAPNPAHAPDAALVIPRWVLEQHAAIESQYESMFRGDPVGAAYFRGRGDVYRELIALADHLANQ